MTLNCIQLLDPLFEYLGTAEYYFMAISSTLAPSLQIHLQLWTD